MTYFEILSIIMASLVFLFTRTRNFFVKRPFYSALMSLILLLGMLIHSNRWQMFSIFILYFLMLIVFSFLSYGEKAKKYKISVNIFRLVGFILIFISLIINNIFPINNLEKLDGKYYVGTSTISITDYGRKNTSIRTGVFRNISVRIFYPSYEKGTKLQSLIDSPIAYMETKNRQYGPVFAALFNYVNEITTNSYYDVDPVNDEEFPLIIIGHDWMQYPEYYYDLAEKLASSGYYVGVVNYTGNSPYAILGDSNIEFGNQGLFNSPMSKDKYSRNIERVSDEMTSDLDQILEGISKLRDLEGSRFSNIDLSNIGMISSGLASVSALNTKHHDNISAVITYDPLIYNEKSYLLEGKLRQDSLILLSKQWLESNPMALKKLMKDHDEKNNIYYVQGFTHNDFTLISLISPLYKLNGASDISYKESLEIRYKTAHSYFDFYLKNKNTKKHMTDLIEEIKEIKKIILRY